MTIKDLAASTGYSVGTVSRALNNHPNVSRKARETIQQAAQRTGFQLNSNAKNLKQQHATSILAIVKGTFNELFSELVEDLQGLLSQTPYPLHVDYIDENSNEVLRAIQLCREQKYLGILFLGGNNQNFKQDFNGIELPCVLVTNDASELPFSNLSSVYTDDRQAARCAADALIALGHRKFVIVGGDRKLSDTSRLRYKGYLQSFRNNNILFDEQLDYQEVRYSYRGGYKAVQNFLSMGRSFTALFAESDVMAIGAIRALWDHGLRVPEDVSVIGFDGLPLGSFLVPQLATIGQDVAQIAKRSVEILLNCIEKQAVNIHETIPFTLYQRESTKRLEEIK